MEKSELVAHIHASIKAGNSSIKDWQEFTTLVERSTLEVDAYTQEAYEAACEVLKQAQQQSSS